MGSQEASQQATQVVLEPRRLGQQVSELNPKDLANICCILHPNSEPARRACSIIRQISPEYTVKNSSPGIIHETTSVNVHNSDSVYNGARDLSSYDIALRLSAQLKNPTSGGFYFGRNSRRCDILIGLDTSKRISNVHFRIYINDYGNIMLEDQSTNGTAVDGVLLRGNVRADGVEYQHLLVSGSLITLTMNLPEGEDDYRFVVRIPKRDPESDEAYQANLIAYFHKIANAKNGNAHNAPDEVLRRNPLNLFPTPRLDLGTNSLSKNLGRKLQEWKGGPKYNKVRRIGSGGFATVYLITSKSDGIPYAAKEVEKRRFMNNGLPGLRLDDEINIMRKINHPNIVKFIEYVDWDEYLYIIMEYVSGGDLVSICGKDGGLNESTVKTLAMQLLSALRYLHQVGITHRDIKPDNILISRRYPLRVKLADFGLSKMIESEETFLKTFCGTLNYCAPEVYSEYREFDEEGKRTLRGVDKDFLPPQRYGHAVDIWSLGGVLFYSLCWQPPYPVKNGTSYIDLLTRIMGQSLNLTPLKYAGVSDDGIHFLQRMLEIRPEYRATISELAVHPWLVEEGNIGFSLRDDNDLYDDFDFHHDFDMYDGIDWHCDYAWQNDYDLLGDKHLSPSLEQSASQLSIQAQRIEESEKETNVKFDSDLTEIPSSGVPGISNISGNLPQSTGSNEIQNHPINNQSNIDKFGDWRSISVTDSDVTAQDKFDFPLPPGYRPLGMKEEKSSMQLLPAPHPAQRPINSAEHGRRDINPSSLLGAESLVGHLNMYSRASPSLPDPEVLDDITVSLRRPREEDSEEDSDLNPWYLEGIVSKRRRKSEGESELCLSKVNHRDTMSRSACYKSILQAPLSNSLKVTDFHKSQGDPPSSNSETLSENFRHSMFSAAESQINTVALSESTKKEVYQNILDKETEHRDSNDKTCRYNDLKNVISPTKYLTNLESRIQERSNASGFQPFSGKDLQTPKYIPARLIATLDSCLPTITINLTDCITSWGRGSKATVRYMDVAESRIPKYAFKIFLFKQGFYDLSRTVPWDIIDQDMSFYISTKASVGIWVNDTNLPSYDRQNPNTESKHWGQLKNGDLITVWRHDSRPTQIFTRFRFECNLSQSKEPRKSGDDFKLIQDDSFLKEIEQACKRQEKFILSENKH